MLTENSPHRNTIITALGVALFALPILLDVLLGGVSRIFQYFAADTFYYLVVARNFGQFGFFTFDHVRAVNGFHPLWQVILGLSYHISLSDTAILYLALILSVLLISAALIVLARCFVVAEGKVPVAFIALPVGAYALINVFFSRQFGSLWSYANGMESGLSLFIYAVLLLLLVSPGFLLSARSTLLIGMVLSMFILSRLDNAFMIGALVLGIAVLHRDRIRGALLMCIPPAVVLITYILVNLVTVGAPIPISGLLKSSGGLAVNLQDLVGVIIYPSQPAELDRLWHHNQMWLPMIVAASFLIPRLSARRRRRMQPFESALWITALFVIVLGGYDLFRVAIWDQGHWYYPISVLFISLFVLRTIKNWRASPRLIGGMVVAVLAFYVFVYRSDTHNKEFAAFWASGGQTAHKHFGTDLKIVEVDDGIVSFVTGYPALSGTGLMLDYEAAEYKSAGNLLTLAYARGFDHVATLAYSSNLMAFFPDRDKFEFIKEYDQKYSADGDFQVFRIVPHATETLIKSP